jgi:uncharacterized membrane protein YhaH (DUF805 family)
MSNLRIQGTILIASLVVQYALGMYVNMFVAFPEGEMGEQLWGFAWSQPALAAHIVLGLLIFIGAIVLCVRAVRARNYPWIWASGIGLLSVLVAVESGSSFIPSQNDIFSYSMAIGFIVAIVAYGWGVFADKQQSQKTA